jgi:heat shock protein HslJ
MQKQKITTVTAVTTVALLTLAACGTESKDGTGSAAGSGTAASDGGGSGKAGSALTGALWGVDSVTVDGKKTAAPAGATVEIDSKGLASARTGCNSMGAAVKVDGDTVTVGKMRTTLIGCEKELASFEKALGGAFSGKLKARIEDIGKSEGRSGGKRLTLTATDGDSIALTSVPPAPLVGSDWTVESLTDGQTATSLPKGMEGKARFTVSKDGSVEGSLGCNTFRGSAQVTASTITFGALRTTRKLCAEPEMALERQVQKVLEGKVTYELRHRSLTLTSAAGKGTGIEAQAPVK